jgi:hypothetical protein
VGPRASQDTVVKRKIPNPATNWTLDIWYAASHFIDWSLLAHFCQSLGS